MKRLLIATAACALALSGCTTRPASSGDVVAHAMDRIDQVEADYRAAKAFVDMLEPLLPASRVTQIHALEAKIEAAIALARRAVTVADQIRAIGEATSAIAELNAEPADASTR